MSDNKMTFHERFVELQSRVFVNKSNFNSFGKYSYRKCEDILAAAKPIANELGLSIVLSDDIVDFGSRVYVKATATISDGTLSNSNTSFAREAEEKKGMDSSQVTGASSSYARKYALSGLLGLDDEKDPDIPQQPTPQKPLQPDMYVKKKELSDKIVALINTATVGLGVAEKTALLKDVSGVNQSSELVKKSVDELEFIVKKINETNAEQVARQQKPQIKTIKDVHFKP